MDENQPRNTGMTFDPSIMQRARSVAGNPWIIFFFAVIVHIVDIIFRWYDGIDIVKLYRQDPTLSLLGNIALKGIIINGVFWVVLASIYFIRRPEDAREFLSLLLLVATVFFVASLTGIISFLGLSNLATLIHLVVIIFGIRNGILVDKYGRTEANFYTIFIIFLDFFAFNIIHAIFPEKAVYLNMVIVPVLPLFILISMDDSKLRSWLLFLITVFYILLVMQTYRVNANLQERLDQSQIEGARLESLNAWEKLKTIFGDFNQSWSESQQIISGDYYTGQVEAYQREPLGVFLEDVKSSDSEFFVNEDVIIWAKLKAYTLEKQNITIKVACSAKDGQNTITGQVTPKAEYRMESYEEEFITCTFDKSLSQKPGFYQVTFNATFDFTTQSYLKTYYIEKERKRTMQSEGIDIFSQYGITDTNPVALFTNGPVKIGMETTTPPIGVPTAAAQIKDFTSYLGITLDNNWKGNIVKLDSLKITLPDGLVFDPSCKIFQKANTTYSLNSSELTLDNQKEYKLPKSYKCALTLNNNVQNSQKLLGTTPIAIRYFKADTTYKYQISETTTVNVKSTT